MDEEFLTAKETASLLNMSTAFVRKMVDSGDMPGTWVTQSGEYRMPRNAVMSFKEQMTEEQLKGLEHLMQDTEEMGLYDKADADAPHPKIEG